MAVKYYLNRDWYFIENFSDACLNREVNLSDYTKVSIPHTVKETPFDYFDEHIYQMESGYVKKLNVPSSWKEKSVLLTFEGVAHRATVYINGSERITHKCGYTAFSVDITEDVNRYDEILISVKVDSNESVNQPPFGYVIDYMTYGGIYRDVYVSVREKTYIDDLFMYGDFCIEKTSLINQITVKNPDAKRLTVKQSVNGVESVKCLNSDKDTFSVEVRNVTLWSPSNPFLYTVETKLYDEDGNLLDARSDRFGFRKAEFKKDGFYLNGEKIKIRGLNRHQSYAYVGYAMPSSMQELDAKILKEELGLNAVRTSHYPQSHDFISKCDELGLLVFMEIPGWQHIGDAEWKDQAVINTKDMVLEFRNHPSIILWGVRINESADDDEFYIRTNKAAHENDPSRPTGGVRALKKSNLFEDVYTYNDFVHDGSNIGCEPKAKVTSDVEKPYLISEYNGHMYPTKTFDWEEHRREHAIRHANVLDAVAGHDDIAGSFGWCMFDYNTHKDFGSGDRICYHGVMDMFRNPKLASYVYACETEVKPNGEDVILEISSSMDIGEHPGCNRGAVWIISNADSVRMYKNDRLIKEYYPSDSPYKNLKHGPVMIDDFVGDAIETGENYSKRLSADIKKMMNATALYGVSNLPKNIMFLAAKAILIHHMSMGDAVRLYNKYVGDWGGTSTVYRFEAVCNGRVVKSLIKEPATKVSLVADASSTVLRPGRTYDVAEVRIKAVDQNGNVLPFFNEPVTFEVSDNAKIIGPKVISLKGGFGAVYVRCDSEDKENVSLDISSSQTETIRINFSVERDTKWNVLK